MAARIEPKPAETHCGDEVAYCTGPECDHPVFRGTLCSAHVKQAQRSGTLAPLAEEWTPQERFRKAVLAYANCETDEEFPELERRLGYAAKRVFGRKAAGEEIRKAVESARKKTSEAIKKAMAEARARGVHVGRPQKVTMEEARKAIMDAGSTRAAAVKLGRHWLAVWRAMRRAPVSKGTLSKQQRRPRPRRGSN